MLENPHMLHLIAKQRHEELLDECRRMQLAKAILKKDRIGRNRTGAIVVAFADFLIKTGNNLKKRRMLKEENPVL